MTSTFAGFAIATSARLRIHADVGVRALVAAAAKQGVRLLPPRGPGPGRP